MTHTFLLIVYLGKNIINQDMYFRSIDSCKYYAERLNQQPAVPDRNAGDSEPKSKIYTAVCEPRKVDSTKTIIYN